MREDRGASLEGLCLEAASRFLGGSGRRSPGLEAPSSAGGQWGRVARVTSQGKTGAAEGAYLCPPFSVQRRCNEKRKWTSITCMLSPRNDDFCMTLHCGGHTRQRPTSLWELNVVLLVTSPSCLYRSFLTLSSHSPVWMLDSLLNSRFLPGRLHPRAMPPAHGSQSFRGTSSSGPSSPIVTTRMKVGNSSGS